MTPRVNHKDMRHCISAKREFKSYSGSVYAKHHQDLYIVFSYGEHFPMYVFDFNTRSWYGNGDKYSPTTSRHQSQANPGVVSDWLDTDTLKRLINLGGLTPLIAARMTQHARELQAA